VCFLKNLPGKGGYRGGAGRAKPPEKNFPPPGPPPPPLLGNVYARRQCYASRVEIAKQNFSPSVAEDFMICLKANNSAYKLVFEWKEDKSCIFLTALSDFVTCYYCVFLQLYL